MARLLDGGIFSYMELQRFPKSVGRFTRWFYGPLLFYNEAHLTNSNIGMYLNI